MPPGGGRTISNVQGNTQGLKPNQLRRIEKLYSRRISPQEVVTPEFARQLSELSHETRRQIGALIDRKGYVEAIVVGDARRIEWPDLKRTRVGEGRFRGLRAVHTHLRGEELTQDDLNDLALLRLDLMVAVDVDERTGLPGKVRGAHLLPTTADVVEDANETAGAYTFFEAPAASQLDVDFLELINSLEEEMARNRQSFRRATARDRAILVGVTTSSLGDAEESMAELRELAASAGIIVQHEIIQKRTSIDPRTVLGRGKLDELLVRALRLGADLIVFDREMSPAQVRSVSEATDLKVIDRAQLILDIFAQRAQTSEGKIQVELAQLRYMLPRLIAGHDSAFSRLAGGIGGRGPGETKLETDRRRVRDRINRLEKEIEHQRMRRQQRRKERTRRGLPVISIVGYTNAGKSTLLNTLTSSAVLAEQRMFATLDPTSRRLRLPREQEVIVNDTVGFIRDLPPDLIAAFRATLEEIDDSDLLIHLVDASNPRWQQQLESVERILGELGHTDIPRIVAFNKADLLAPEDLDSLLRQACQVGGRECLAVSALDPVSLRALLERAGAILARDLTHEEHTAHDESGAGDAEGLGTARSLRSDAESSQSDAESSESDVDSSDSDKAERAEEAVVS
ncbi:MAG: GTPase [Acidobacteriota bacterium]|jgi:GTP-binding protein HflX|nr:GTPase [Acidobacteriota bacterium]